MIINHLISQYKGKRTYRKESTWSSSVHIASDQQALTCQFNHDPEKPFCIVFTMQVAVNCLVNYSPQTRLIIIISFILFWAETNSDRQSWIADMFRYSLRSYHRQLLIVRYKNFELELEIRAKAFWLNMGRNRITTAPKHRTGQN